MEIIETARAPSLFSGSCAAELLYQIATLSPSPPPPQSTPDIPIAARQPRQQDLLLALSFCRAVYGLTFRKGRSGMLRRNKDVKHVAAC